MDRPASPSQGLWTRLGDVLGWIVVGCLVLYLLACSIAAYAIFSVSGH